MNNVLGRDSKWIWYVYSRNTDFMVSKNELVYFRRSFYLDHHPVSLIARVSADSRYRLYINGIAISIGPCKGNQWNTYYETVDLSSFLKKGKNVLAVKVLHFANNQPYEADVAGPTSIVRTSSGGFMLDGVILDGNGTVIEDISTCETWKARKEQGIEFIPPVRGIWAAAFEHVMAENMISGWNSISFDDHAWDQAAVIADSLLTPKPISDYGQTFGWDLTERTIPSLYEHTKKFTSVTKTAGINRESIEALIHGRAEVVFPASSQFNLELDAGELTTAYINLKMSDGRGSKIKLIYSECYEQEENGVFKKGVRDDANGVLRGDFDVYEPDRGNEEYEPFWFRTFRFIRVEITTGDNELVLKDLYIRETGYPLDITGRYESSDETHEKLWDISIRSLKRCMHETYEDCPYYEQLQYIMDTRLQALFTYQISTDDRLARKSIDEFHTSLTPSGLLQSRYPSVMRQIIPGFSLHWIFMLEDHLMYFGDLELIKRYRPTMDAILDWFDRKLTAEGLVGKTGYWSFVDWVEGWDLTSVPTANRVGPITVYSLMYIKALKSAAFLNSITAREGIAQEYIDRAQKVIEAVKKLCWNKEKMLFTDGPGIEEFSEHSQVWAVIAGVVHGEEAAELLSKMMDSNLSKISYAMSFYLFRALELAGMYVKTDKLLDTWRELAELRLTTWVEDPVTQRSDCHGWGALPLYEFPAMILGVKPADIGYKKIMIRPNLLNLQYAKGLVNTINGPVAVEWKVHSNVLNICVSGPKRIPIELVLPNGEVCLTDDGEIKQSLILLQ